MVYGSSTVKRSRRTRDQLADLDDAIVNAVAAEYPVTLRGVFYRVSSAGAVDKTENGYRAVGRRLLGLRRDGRIPYDRITDGTRWVVRCRAYNDLEQMLDDAAASYRRRLWNDQHVSVNLFTEKDAISGVIDPITVKWDVPLGVLRGYASESFAYTMAESIRAARRPVYIYQLGDHDPSGVDAWRDFEQKVTAFVGERPSSCPLHFQRLAVTPEQIEQWNLPTRPTKQKDTRAKNFVGESVEVDAIPANTLREIVEQAIEQHIDTEALRLTREVERQERAGLYALKGNHNTHGGYGGWSQ